MNRTARRMALATGLVALTLTACGERDSSSTTADPTTTEPSESESSAPPVEETPDFKACMVSDSGGFDDKSFNQTSFKGLTDAEEQFGIETGEVESNSDAEYADNIAALVEEGCNQITTVGFLLGDATLAAAKKDKDVDFAIVDFAYEKAPPNLKGLVFNTGEPSFLAGYAAAATSETGTVGTFGGLNIPSVTDFMTGFLRGVEYFNEQGDGLDVTVLGWDGTEGSFTEDFEDKAKGQQVAEQMIQQGADVIFPVAGPAGLGGLQAAQDGDVQAIWVDTDGCVSTDYCDVLLTSVTKGLDVSVTAAIESSLNDEFSNELYVGTLENGGVGLGQYGESVNADLEATIEELKQMIIDGDIKVS
ncbi:MAG: BMP family ABC transporter substrate-binding protein [Nocardioidaceae bacterium]